MFFQRIYRAVAWAALITLAAAPLPPTGLAANPPATAGGNNDTGWPRQVGSGDQLITIYQPQVESWKQNRLTERAAVAIGRRAAAQPVYGVIWISARTEVDKANGLVTLEDVRITRASFPSAPAQAASYLAELRRKAPASLKLVSLERLRASLAIAAVQSKKTGVALENAPPRVFYSPSPAILVLIDGDPVLRDAGSDGLLRVINTRALLLLDRSSGDYYLFIGDRWMTARSPEGPWKTAGALSPGFSRSLEQAKQAAVSQKQVDLLNEPRSALMQELRAGTVPKVFVSTKPAELIQTQGQPMLQPIAGTDILYVENTADSIFLDPATQRYYVLISGRWYTSSTLASGKWKFVSAKTLPAGFRDIPEGHPKGDVLASVADTPQAGEAAISNEIPQTATIDRSRASLSVPYDGAPEFRPIEGTPLQYAINTPTPVIEVDPQSFYSVQNGIWFAGTSPNGPWAVADRVPAVIYTIPPSSPLYYVTYVYVYGSTPQVVYTGYLPGYLGSYVSADGVVVYGTGYFYPYWAGSVWYGPPMTYGWGVGWGPGFGWAFGTGFFFGVFAGAFFHPWWGPWGWAWAHGIRYGGVAGYPVNINHVNFYRNWARPVIRNSWERNEIAARSAPAPRNRPNNVYAGRQGNVYRRSEGGWQQYGNRGWQGIRRSSPGISGLGTPQTPRADIAGELERERNARALGEMRSNAFRQQLGMQGLGRSSQRRRSFRVGRR